MNDEVFNPMNDGLFNPDFRADKRPGHYGWSYQPIKITPPLGLGGDVHETLKFDEYGNLIPSIPDITGVHTTIRIKGGQHVNMPWQPSETAYNSPASSGLSSGGLG